MPETHRKPDVQPSPKEGVKTNAEQAHDRDIEQKALQFSQKDKLALSLMGNVVKFMGREMIKSASSPADSLKDPRRLSALEAHTPGSWAQLFCSEPKFAGWEKGKKYTVSFAAVGSASLEDSLGNALGKSVGKMVEKAGSAMDDAAKDGSKKKGVMDKGNTVLDDFQKDLKDKPVSPTFNKEIADMVGSNLGILINDAKVSKIRITKQDGKATEATRNSDGSFDAEVKIEHMDQVEVLETGSNVTDTQLADLRKNVAEKYNKQFDSDIKSALEVPGQEKVLTTAQSVFNSMVGGPGWGVACYKIADTIRTKLDGKGIKNGLKPTFDGLNKGLSGTDVPRLIQEKGWKPGTAFHISTSGDYQSMVGSNHWFTYVGNVDGKPRFCDQSGWMSPIERVCNPNRPLLAVYAV